MRYRTGNNDKIKAEHAIITGIKSLLLTIESWEEVKSVIPGRIKSVNKSHPPHIKVQYETIAGLKCLALSGPAIQEVFIVSNNADVLKMRLENL